MNVVAAREVEHLPMRGGILQASVVELWLQFGDLGVPLGVVQRAGEINLRRQLPDSFIGVREGITGLLNPA